MPLKRARTASPFSLNFSTVLSLQAATKSLVASPAWALFSAPMTRPKVRMMCWNAFMMALSCQCGFCRGR